MPSLFTRSRTASTPNKAAKDLANTSTSLYTDEFGRVTSRGSVNTPTPSKKDKKKEKDKDKRTRKESASDGVDVQSLPEGSFLPFAWGEKESVEEKDKLKKYGYLSYHAEVTLGVEEVSRLVEVIAAELNDRGALISLIFCSC